jgi:hypothetical protein
MCYHTEIWGLLINMKNETELKPKGILLKMDWDEMIMDLDESSVGKMIKNIYNYLNDRKLVEMDNMETMLFKHTIRPVLDYNSEKYQQKVEHNRRVAPKGGRKPKSIDINPMGLIETQKIPSGSFNNPENPKDIERDIDIERDKEREIERIRIREEIVKIKKLLELDEENIEGKEEVGFYIEVKKLVKHLGWSRFELLIFFTSESDVESLLLEYGELECLQEIQNIRNYYSYFLDVLIK